MKKLLFKKQFDPENKQKTVSIRHKTNDEECITHVKKSFVYTVSKTKEVNPKVESPQIYIRKSFNNKTSIEKFNFQVKGHFYTTHKRVLVKVGFHHTLDIQILWKVNDFSPKKSEVLTE